jgi:hypothetical protein
LEEKRELPVKIEWNKEVKEEDSKANFFEETSKSIVSAQVVAFEIKKEVKDIEEPPNNL